MLCDKLALRASEHPRMLWSVIGGLTLVLCLSSLFPHTHTTGFFGVQQHVVREARDLPSTNVSAFGDCLHTYYTGTYDFIFLQCSRSFNSFPDNQQNCRTAINALDGATYTTFNTSILIPYYFLTTLSNHPSIASVVTQFGEGFVDSGSFGVAFGFGNVYYTNNAQENVYVFADALGALRAVLRRVGTGTNDFPVLVTSYIITSPVTRNDGMCTDTSRMDVGSEAGAVTLRAATNLIPDLRVNLILNTPNTTETATTRCGFGTNETFQTSYTNFQLPRDGACGHLELRFDTTDSDAIYVGATFTPISGSEPASPNTAANFEVRDDLEYGYGLSASGLADADVNNSDVITCMGAGDVALNDIGTQAFMVVDCGQLTSSTTTTTCSSALSALDTLASGGTNLQPVLMLFRLLLHPEAVSDGTPLSVGEQVESIVSIVGGRSAIGVVLRPIGYSSSDYLPLGYDLEPKLTAPGGGVVANEANLEALYAGLYTLASLYGGSGGTEGMALPRLRVWLQVSSTRDCSDSGGGFVPTSRVSVGNMCSNFTNLACGFVNGDPVESSGSSCGFSDMGSGDGVLANGWTISYRSLFGADSEDVSCSSDTGLRGIGSAPSLAFVDTSTIPSAQTVTFGRTFGAVVSVDSSVADSVAECLSDDTNGLGAAIGLVDCRSITELDMVGEICGGGVGAVARGGVSDGAVSVAAAGIVSIASDTTNGAGATAISDLLEQNVSVGVFVEINFESGASGSTNIGRVVGLLTELSEQVAGRVSGSDVVTVGLVVSDFGVCGSGGALNGGSGTTLYDSLSGLDNLSVYLVNMWIDTLSDGGSLGFACGFPTERLVVGTSSIPSLSGTCLSGVPNAESVYSGVSFSVGNLPGSSTLPENPDPDDDNDGGGGNNGVYALFAIPVVVVAAAVFGIAGFIL